MNSPVVTLEMYSLILVEFKVVCRVQDTWTAQQDVNFNARSLDHMGSYSDLLPNIKSYAFKITLKSKRLAEWKIRKNSTCLQLASTLYNLQSNSLCRPFSSLRFILYTVYFRSCRIACWELCVPSPMLFHGMILNETSENIAVITWWNINK
jgi:hypothetical protein